MNYLQHSNTILAKELLTEAEINLIKNRLNNNKFRESELAFNYDDGYLITPEQTTKGIDFLRNLYQTPKGLTRKNNPFGKREIEAISTDNFSHFTFDGYYNGGNAWVNYYLPIYSVVAKDGYGFQYYYQRGEVNIIG